MATDEPKREDTQGETVVADTPPEVPEETSQAQEEPVEEIPETYKGKTSAELVKILQDKENFINQQSGEVGTLRGKVGDLENQVAYNQQFEPKEPQVAQTTPQETPATDPLDDDYPTWGELRKINEQATRRDGMIRNQIQVAAPFLEQAKKEAPQLFKGLTDQEIQGTAYQYLSSNQVHPTSLSQTRTWKMAASFIQGEKTDYNFVPTHKVIEAVEPVDTAIPSQAKPTVSEEGLIPISEEDRQYAREVLGKLNVSDDEIREMIKDGAEAQRTGVK